MQHPHYDSKSNMHRRHRKYTIAAMISTVTAACMIAGCTSTHYAERADRQVYGILADKAADVPGMAAAFRIVSEQEQSLSEFLKERPDLLTNLTLADAVQLAAAHSRDFQAQREDVYLEALALTLERHLWSPRYQGILGALWAYDDGERTVSADSDFGLDWALATGANLGVSLSSDFIRFLSGDPRENAGSLIAMTLRQPLLRGAGADIAQEELTQAERNTIYQMRSFVRFRRRLYVDVATDFYRILQQRDVIANEKMNLDNLTTARERAEMLFEAGRLQGMQVDQARQDELRARDRWLRAQQQYETLIDSFKITVGVPVNQPLTPDRTELERLAQLGLTTLTGNPEEAARAARQKRLDLMTAADRVNDAQRKVNVAANNLRPDLDVVLAAATGTQPETTLLKFSDEDRRYSAGIEADLPFDRLAERNSYRRALIQYDRQTRNHDLLQDQVVQQIREDWRRLREARSSYRIQQQSVDLAGQRVESITMLIEAGRAEMRDLLEAQEALLQARNQLTARLVDYRTQLLSLWRDTESLTFSNGEFQGE
ncbi:MAG: TolC family protein [Candidatus Pacebacteria bacterium]|nr:TolC family protein [Candidatus Paceibacterota bacterium]